MSLLNKGFFMKKINLVRFVHSLVLIPAMTMPITFGGINSNEISANVLAQKSSFEASILMASTSKNEAKTELEAKKSKAEAIDAYFKSKNMPLAGTGMTMVLEAEKNDIDWRLLPAIAIRESTGGIHACKKATFNSFGWGSCKINFKSNESAIETVARNLGGNNPNTDHHYAGKTTKEILQKYNPPSIVPRYADQVINIMNTIGGEEMNIISPSKVVINT